MKSGPVYTRCHSAHIDSARTSSLNHNKTRYAQHSEQEIPKGRGKRNKHETENLLNLSMVGVLQVNSINCYPVVEGTAESDSVEFIGDDDDNEKMCDEETCPSDLSTSAESKGHEEEL